MNYYILLIIPVVWFVYKMTKNELFLLYHERKEITWPLWITYWILGLFGLILGLR